MSAPTTTVNDIFDRARGVYLNDADGRVWPNAKLVPFLKASYDMYQTELANNALSTLDTIASPVTILAGATTYGTLPTDFVWPIKLEERTPGSVELYSPMYQFRWENNIRQGDILLYWSFRGDAILFPGALTDREVLLYYQKLYPDFPAGTGDPVIDKTTSVYGHALAALSAGIAAFIHKFVTQNNTMADSCNGIAKDETFKVINLYVKAAQSIPSRPRPFRTFWRLGGYTR